MIKVLKKRCHSACDTLDLKKFVEVTLGQEEFSVLRNVIIDFLFPNLFSLGNWGQSQGLSKGTIKLSLGLS